MNNKNLCVYFLGSILTVKGFLSNVMWDKLVDLIVCAFDKFYKRDFCRHWPEKSYV